jgi:undecaprenyl phosphate N,N'-diacetylbacillosamine 1-phosphate transferase
MKPVEEGETPMKFCKRLIDLAGAVVGLLLTLPLTLSAAVAIAVTTPGPVFFIQERVGQGGRLFRIYKFRTMVDGAENIGDGYRVTANDQRITTVGKILRKTSIDELPQLLNVLKGEMSLVGPRPTLAYQVEKYTPRQRRRLEMKPGITGWAQIHGRTQLTWPERIEYDLWYVENWSLALDLKIIFRTFSVLLNTKQIYRSDNDAIASHPTRDRSAKEIEKN